MSANSASAAACRFPCAAAEPVSLAARRESQLVERARRGDLAAYEQLVREHERLAYRLARAITRDDGDAEEATQEAFLKAYRSLGRFRRGAPFRPWLLKIVTNEAHSRQRARRRTAAIAARALAAAPGQAAAPGADAGLARAEDARQLAAALDRLPDPYRDVVACRYLLELTERETAAALGIRPGTVKSRLSRALARLEQELPAA